jgi:hypothetical protein
MGNSNSNSGSIKDNEGNEGILTKFTKKKLDALQKIVRKPGEVGTIGPLDVQYPANDVEQWCNIGIYEYIYRAESEKSLKHGLGNVKLPLPLQLQTQYQQQWNNFDDLASLAIGSLRSGASVESQLKNVAFTEEFATAVGGAIGLGSGTGALGALAGAVSASSISQGLTALGGVAANKFETVTYQKPELRQHQFSWNLTAKNRDEGIAIQNIIKKLKYHSHPGGGDNSGAYFKYPEVFVIKFFSDQNLFTIGPSVLERFGVDYHASGRPLYQASDRMPINVAINCSFRETAAVTKNSIENEGR